MSYHSGTATDYRDLLQKIVDFATSPGTVDTAVVNAPGTAYVAGDILTVAGGTVEFTGTECTIEVLTVDGSGLILTSRIVHNGAYSANPSTPNSVTDVGPGSGATFDLTFKNVGWTLNRETEQASTSTAISAAGLSYTAGDDLTVVGGGPTAATFNVDTVGGSGEVLTITRLTAGVYHFKPTSPAATTVSPAGGSGCTLTMAYEAVASAVLQEFLLEGEGAGSDQIFVGIREFTPSGSTFNWELAGMTGFDVDASWTTQPQISPGRHDIAGEEGAFVYLNDGSTPYWFFIDERRIMVVARPAGGTYSSMYLGWLNPFGTAVEYPYPLLVMSSGASPTRNFTTNDISYSSIVDPVSFTSPNNAGPGFLWLPGGGWQSVQNGLDDGASRIEANDLIVAPAGGILYSAIPDVDQFFFNSFSFRVLIPHSGDPGSATVDMLPTDDTGGNLTPLVPATIIMQSPQFQILGEMSGAFWASTSTGGTVIVAEDTFDVGTEPYIIFKGGNRTERWAHWVAKKR